MHTPVLAWIMLAAGIAFIGLIAGCGSLRYTKPVGYDDDQPIPKNFDFNVDYHWPESHEAYCGRRARNMVGRRIAQVETQGCMAHIRVVRKVGRFVYVFTTPDPATEKPILHVRCQTDEGDWFDVIVARCWYNRDAGQWEEII